MNTRRLLILIVVCVIAAVSAWMVSRGRRAQPLKPGEETPQAANGSQNELPADVAGPFAIGVASLDVEENERAGRVFNELSRQIPDEPAVWANLGIVRLRTGDLPGADEALQTAARLAPANDRILVLQALVDERRGEFPKAIERLRSVPKPDVVVLYRLAELLGRTGRDADPQEQLAVFDRLHELDPTNIVAAFGRARLLARTNDGPALTAAIKSLETWREEWGPASIQQFESATKAAAEGNFRGAATHLTFLQNLSLATPTYQQALAALGVTGGSIGHPMTEFVKYPQPEAAVSDADHELRFADVRGAASESPLELYRALVLDEKPGATVLSLSGGQLQIREGVSVPVPASSAAIGRDALCAVDLNGDFLADLAFVSSGGLKIWMQDSEGQFTAYEPTEELRPFFDATGDGVWKLDFEADGDLDLIVGREGAPPQLLRNNGDGGYAAVADAFASFPSVRDVKWNDFDGDGDADLALLDEAGRLLVSWNDRSGAFTTPAVISELSAVALSFGDLTANGVMDLVVLDRSGRVSQLRFDQAKQSWSEREVASWSTPPDLAEAFSKRRASIDLCDLDNNGAPDVVVSAGSVSAIWLNHGRGELKPLEAAPALSVMSVEDVDGDGHLDLVGPAEAAGAIFHGRSSKKYHWQSIQTRTLSTLADGRLNSYGLGGHVEIRAEQLLASAPITSPRTHFGLGSQSQIGVTRIVWPNGVAQVEFELQADRAVMAVQRLKGSCPWVFTRDGDTFHFVKDFIWRSPLGMRINSQDTAGVEQTEDWILLPGRLLSEQDGAYEVRVTAELWETHFFDQIALMVVDHPETVEAFVDERFVATSQPKLEVIGASAPQPFVEAWNESGRNVLQTLAKSDHEYVDDFPLGRFQGIAKDHWVEFRLPYEVPDGERVVIIGEGWIYPTDSSLNVAISQGEHDKPRGLVLEEEDPEAGWRTVSGDLGFPAGKNKTVVIPLPAESLQAGQRRFRLRTNLEVYWDQLGWAVAQPDAEIRTTRVETLVAELRHRGFSRVAPPARRRPDIPDYDQLTGTGAIWRDLEGFYTRYGDVRELLKQIDDRYVIMNAGDEFVLRFAAPEPPPAGWTRDFVLIGDGWVKDGDFNTANSTTVHPLPTHELREYGGPPQSVEKDPVFQRNIDDWEHFHTRFISPSDFGRGLMNGARDRRKGGSP